MHEVELWGRPGGPEGRAPMPLVEEIHHLIRRFAAEAVVQVAVLESQVLPVDAVPGDHRG